MMPRNAPCLLHDERQVASPAPNSGMVHAAEATIQQDTMTVGRHPTGMAFSIARARPSRSGSRARRISMSMRMLIDARHPEETRVAVATGNRIEEFDFESAEHKQLKGNIYLAKVTRVEPSLQAAFIDYGGNRHGFLAFSEIHPDYYQIPKADREALLREEAEHAAEEERLRAAEDDDYEDDAERDDPSPSKPRPKRPTGTPRPAMRKPAPARTARRSMSPPPTNCARSARTCVAATRSRTSSSAARCCSFRSSRKSAATRARLSRPI